MALQRFQEAVQSVDSATFYYTHDYEITEIPDDIKQLKTITQVVHIGNCFQLRRISSSIGDLSLLRWLNLSYNGLQEIPASISKLRHLERLHVNNNQLTSLPIELWGLKNLEELRIESNMIRAVPTAVVFFTKLREFFPENNNFVTNSDVEGSEIPSLFKIPSAGDCSNCQGRFGKASESFVTFQQICASNKIPVLHICCGEECKSQLQRRLQELN
eukprot:GILI01018195.1.p1 GENE.GILI01018195.1~~GILI01018195.1.p1  ORF type:complete len:216 (+),score=16.37 GILI01018195.1:39-686(+)